MDYPKTQALQWDGYDSGDFMSPSPRWVALILVMILAVPILFSQVRNTSSTNDTPLPPDNYIWLEDVHSPRAMEWVKAQNARTAKVLEADPRFTTFEAEALKVSEDPNRLPMPMLLGDTVYNFWRDKTNVRGLLRRTTLADYNTATPTGRPFSTSTPSTPPKK